jgi:hypothetical protein
VNALTANVPESEHLSPRKTVTCESKLAKALKRCREQLKHDRHKRASRERAARERHAREASAEHETR